MIVVTTNLSRDPSLLEDTMQLFTPNALVADRYRVVRLLGSGGTSAVYEARDTARDLPVALKQNGLPQQRGRWAREARQLVALAHPALPRAEAYVDFGDVQCLAMEYIGGNDLEQLAVGGLAPDDVLDWADHLLDALVYMHSQRPALLHGAITPRNLRLTARAHPILLDFAILPIAARPEQARLRAAHAYLAPEQLQGRRVDGRSDLYGLAATLYHLLAGIPPIDARTRLAALAASQPDPLQPVDYVRANLPAAVAAVLHAALALNPDVRHPDAAAFRSALGRARDGRPPAPPRRPSRLAGWRRWLAP